MKRFPGNDGPVDRIAIFGLLDVSFGDVLALNVTLVRAAYESEAHELCGDRGLAGPRLHHIARQLTRGLEGQLG